MKFFIKFSIVSLSLAGLILLILPLSVFPDFYDVRYMGWAALVGAAIIYFVPRFLQVSPQNPHVQKKNQAVDLLQWLLAVVIMANALGDLGLYQLYKIGFEFDKVIHFIIPLTGVLILPLFFQGRFGMLPLPSIALAFFLSLPLGVGWEIFEYLADYFLGTHIYGVYGQNMLRDTKLDLLFDASGSTLAVLIGIFIPNWKNKMKLS